MGKKIEYLTMREKYKNALEWKESPLGVSGSSNKNGFISKLRGTIFDGTLIKISKLKGK